MENLNAAFMASCSDYKGSFVRILDPGCGTVVLACSLIEHLVDTNKNLESIDLVAYETDAEIIPFSNQALGYLKKLQNCEKFPFHLWILLRILGTPLSSPMIFLLRIQIES